MNQHFKYTFYDDVPEEGCLARPRQYPDDIETWENACHTLAYMHGLRDVEIVIKGSWLHHDPNVRILEPLRKVKVHGSFEVYMPVPKMSALGRDQDLDFSVIDTYEEDQCKFCE